ncbi:MAG: cytochrome c [Kofleriaceae bacterium]|nr:MAG: cytochrome c [Kofleriaceae bacterium]MBZ0235992.1 cytochrome c [Kofleriaceae bacterium]
MKRALTILGSLVGLVLLAGAGFVAYVQIAYTVDYPRTPLPAITARTDAATIARGEYLVHAVAHCSTCHGPADLMTQRQLDFRQPLVGGFTWELGPLGLFGSFTARNLTPHATGIGAMSDGQLARVIRHGVDSRGKLSPMMRIAVGPMSDEDLTAIISWLRAQAPVEARRPSYELGFLGKVAALDFRPRLDPPPAHVPEGELGVARGKYLAEGPAACVGCHTPADPIAGFARSGPLFSGEAEAEVDPTNTTQEIIAPNLTPDPETGHLAGWTEDVFVARFRAGRVIKGSKMPWEGFALMTENDLRSLYRYLQTVPPARRQVGRTVRPR